MKGIRSPLFLADIEASADYLYTEAGELVLDQWSKSLKATIRLIEKFPELGRLRLDIPFEGIRSLNLKRFPNWLVFYRADKKRVEFLRIKHGMMYLPGLFETAG